MMINVALLCILLCSQVCLVRGHGHSLTGYQFEDNKSDKRYVEDNGEMTFSLPAIPHHLATCFNLYINHNRYSSLVPIMDFRTSYNKEYMEFFFGSIELAMTEWVS